MGSKTNHSTIIGVLLFLAALLSLANCATGGTAAENPFTAYVSVGARGHGNSVTPPPSQVAQSLDPATSPAYTADSSFTGLLGPFNANGAIPNTVTFALSGTDAASFNIDANSGDVVIPVALSVGTKNITVDVTNSAGVAHFPRTISITTANAVAQTLTPGAVTINTTTSGFVTAWSAGGGFPTNYAYTVAGADAADFTIPDSSNGIMNVVAPLAVGTYNITIHVVNTTGSADFPRVITVVDATDVYATPDESTLPAAQVTLTCYSNCTGSEVTNSTFAVASSTVAGITTGGTPKYASFKAAVDDVGSKGAPLGAKLNMPAGEFTECFSGAPTIDEAIYIIGQVDGNNDPTTKIIPAIAGCTASPSGAINAIGVKIPTYRTIWLKNLYIGPNAATVAGTQMYFESCTPPANMAFTCTNYTILPGDVITGVSSGATATASAVTVANGSMAAGTAKGFFDLTSRVGTFSSNERINVGANTNVGALQFFAQKAKTGQRHFNLTQSGRVNIINSVFASSRENCIFGQEFDEWNQRPVQFLWMYDSEVYGCASNGDEHNIYFHEGSMYFIRSYTHDTQGSHGFKSANHEKIIFVNSYCLKDTLVGIASTSNTSACVNVTRTGDNRFARSVVSYKSSSSTGISLIDITQRNDTYGGYGLKMPPVTDDMNHTVDFHGSLKWGPNQDPNAPYWTANAGASIACGSPPCAVTMSVKQISYDVKGPSYTPSTSTSYVWRVQLASGAGCPDACPVQEFTANPATTSTVSFNANGAINSAAAIAFRLASSADWSYRATLNPKYFSTDSPNYWWGTFIDGAGGIDLTKLDQIYSSFFEDMFFYVETPGAGQKLIEQVTDEQAEYGYGGARVARIPKPPINNPAGATVAWPNHAGYGSWTAPLVNGSTITKGINGASNDWTYPFPVFANNWGIYVAQGAVQQQMQRTFENAGATDATGPGYIDYLEQGCSNAGHANDYCLKRVTDITGSSPLSTRGQTLLTAPASAGTHSFTVANGLVCQNGWSLELMLPPGRGYQDAVFLGTIDQAPGATTLHTAEATPRIASPGTPAFYTGALSCFSPGGSKPSTWVDYSQYPVH